MKQETSLKSAFIKELKLQLPHFEVLLVLTAGGADRAIIGNGHVTFWEFKHATPEFSGTGLQELTSCRLNSQSFCRYVVWWESKTGLGKKTMVFHPRVIKNGPGTPQMRKPWLMEPEEVVPDFDHKWLVTYLRGIHRC